MPSLFIAAFFLRQYPSWLRGRSSSVTPLLFHRPSHLQAMGQPEARPQPRSVSWLAPIVSSESIPGRGLKCWLAVPVARLGGLAPALLGAVVGVAGAPSPGTPRAAERKGSSSASSTSLVASSLATAVAAPASGSSAGSAPAVHEMRVVIGNRRLMQDEGVAVSSQVS